MWGNEITKRSVSTICRSPWCKRPLSDDVYKNRVPITAPERSQSIQTFPADVWDYGKLAINMHYHSFKTFFHFWLAKSTRIIHHKELRLIKFGKIFVILNRWHQKCSPSKPRKPGDEVEWEQNGWTVGETFYSFHGELLSKIITRTARHLDGRHFLFGVSLPSWTGLYLLNVPIKISI